MHIYKTYEAGLEELLYVPGPLFQGSFLWLSKGGLVKAVTYYGYVTKFFAPVREAL